MDNGREDNGPALTAVGYSFVNGNDPRLRAFVASLSAAITLYVFDAFKILAAAVSGEWGKYWFGFVVAIGLFNFAYYVLSQVVTWSLAHFTDQTRIRGQWLHVLYFDENSVRKVRHGPVHIRANASGDLRVNGINLALNNTYNSNWHSVLVGLNETRLTLIFESLTPYRGGIMGLMVLDVFKSATKHDVLVGYFSDATVGGMHGHIMLFRDEQDYRTELARISKMPAYDPSAKETA